MKFDEYIEIEKAFLSEYSQKLDNLRQIEQNARLEKIGIMNRAGLACSWDDPDYYMFHNPFVWIGSEYHRPWPNVDYNIANRVLEIEKHIRRLWDEFYWWEKENNPWYTKMSEVIFD